MSCTRHAVGAFAFLLFNCAAAYLSVPQFEKGATMNGPIKGKGHLHIITLEPGKVEGEYRAAGDDGRASGVYFLSEVKEDSRILLITTLGGEQLYRAVSPHNKDILVSLMGNDFLLKHYKDDEGRTAFQGYLVPAASVAAIEMTLDESDGIDERLFSSNDETQSLPVMQRSYATLLRRVEGTLFVHASEKLGRDIGVLGSEYPAAMSLYVLAMRLAKEESVPPAEIPRRARSASLKAQQSCPAKMLYCSNSKSCCNKCPEGDSCIGMCGPKCNCWSWACGDCCFHQGCYDHDLCCKKHNYISWNCLGVWNFQCNSYRC